MTLRTFTSCLAGLLALTGCDGVRLADSVDLVFDFNLLDGPSDELHSPYVAGAELDLYTINVDAEDEVGLSIRSSDASVLSIDAMPRAGVASATATGAGEVELFVRDERETELHRTVVEVVAPDRADLLAHGPMIVDREELQPESTDEIRVLVGGTGTFLVRWFADQRRLFGHGALTTESDPGVMARPRRSYVFEDREWVSFSATEEGRHEVRLLANGELVRTITVIGVVEEDIDDVRLHGMDESDAAEGQGLVVYAQAYTEDDVPIYGVEYEWDIDGETEDGLGDLFRYRFTPGVTGELCARHGMFEAITTISANEGFVDSSNDIGCAVGRGEPTWIALPLVAVLFSMLWARRRRSHT